MDIDLWTKIQDEIKLRVEAEPSLGSFCIAIPDGARRGNTGDNSEGSH